MKKSLIHLVSMLLLIALIFLSCTKVTTVTTYPGPSGIPESNKYSVRINNGSEWLSSFMYFTDGNDAHGEYKHVSFTNFEMSGGSVTVEVTNLSGAITSCRIRPKRLGITTEINGSKATFKLEKPLKIQVEINDDPVNLCFVFSNPPDSGKPEGTTYYYGPGVYDVGKIKLKSNEKVYVAGGAYVKGVFQFDSATSNQEISGYGIISSEKFRGYPEWKNMNGSTSGSFGQTIKNVTLIKPCDPFILTDADVDLVENVKIIAHPDHGRGLACGGNGGMTMVSYSRPYTCRNNFIFCGDDAIVIDGSRVKGSVVQNCVIYNTAASSLLGIWNSGETCDLIIRDCNIIGTHVHNYADQEALLVAYADNPFGSHSPVHDILIENITIESCPAGIARFLSLTSADVHNGPIYNINFKNIKIEGTPLYKSNLHGLKDKTVNNITFNNLTIGGTLVTDSNKVNYFDINSYTDNIKFTSSENAESGK
jgi:hypothetical protein